MKTKSITKKNYILLLLLIVTTIHTQTLQDMVSLDFSETQFTFYDPMECSFATFLFKITNTSDHDIGIFRDSFTFNGADIHQVAAPQGGTILEPGGSMWMRSNFPARLLGYDYKIKQDVAVTIKVEMHDWLNQYEGSGAQFSFEKEIIIKVSGGESSPLCEVPFNITVNDEQGNPTDAFLDILGPSPEYDGTWFNNNTINIDNSGRIETSLPMSSRYLVYIRKDGYSMFSSEYSLNEIPAEINVQLQRKTVNQIPQFTLKKEIKGDIGFWRGAVNKTGDKILLVQGMENYYDDGLYDECKLFYLDVDAEEILWEYPIGWQSWVADIDDAGKYATVATLYADFHNVTPPDGFVNYVAVLNQSTGQEIWKKNIIEDNFPGIASSVGYSMGLRFSHGGDYLFVSVEVGGDFLLNSDDGSIIWSNNDIGNVREILFTDDDEYLFVSTYGGIVYKIRTSDGEIIWRQWSWCWAYINGFEISQDGNYLAVGAKGGGISVINCETGEIKFSLMEYNESVSFLRWMNGNNDLLVSGSGGMSRLYDIDGNKKVCFSQRGGGFDWRIIGDSYLINDSGEIYDIQDGESQGQVFRLGKEGRISHFGWYSPAKNKYIWAVTETRSRNENIIEIYDVDINTGVENDAVLQVPTSYQLYQNYPNPFNPTTKIRFGLPEESQVMLKIYDVLGREVTTLINSTQGAGYYNYTWNASNISSGIYFYVLTAKSLNQNYREIKKMLLLK